MSKNKHTLGPWWSPDGRTIKQDYRPLTEVGGCIIAGVIGGSTSGPCFIEDDDEVAANTRLIAAAPDLLSLLEEARRTLEMWKDVAPAVSLCADIDRVIAKATGEQP